MDIGCTPHLHRDGHCICIRNSSDMDDTAFPQPSVMTFSIHDMRHAPRTLCTNMESDDDFLSMDFTTTSMWVSVTNTTPPL